MLDELAGNWVNGLHFFFDVTNYMPVVPNLWDRQLFHTQHTRNIKIRKPDVLLGYAILFWAMLYFMYEKCLNSLLRRMRIPLMQRNRIIEAAWNCGFCVGSICYLKSSPIKFLNFNTEEEQVTYEELGVILHKSFYFHRAGIEILRHKVWIKGLANLLFASFIMNPYREKWCTVVSTLLFYKAIDTVIINICRILLCLSHFIGRSLPKIFFWLHAINWIYLYVLFVPKLMLWPEKTHYTKAELSLWLWFIAECLDSVWLRLVGCARAVHWLEICLFPPPTQEAIELASIQRKHRDSLKRQTTNKVIRKSQMWQTLMCVMAIKTKVKRMRKSKEQESPHSESSEYMQEDTPCLDVEDEVDETEVAELNNIGNTMEKAEMSEETSQVSNISGITSLVNEGRDQNKTL